MRRASRVAAAAGVAVATWLVTCGGWSEAPPELPSELRHASALDAVPVAHPTAAGGSLPAEEAPPAAPPGAPAPDPVLTALPGGGSALVVRADALRRSFLGQRLIDCFLAQGGQAALELFRRSTGVDPLEDLRQLGVSREGLVLGGRFAGARFDALLTTAGLRARPHGTHGRIYSPPSPRRWVRPDGVELEVREAWGLWRDELLLLGPGAAEVERAIDRLEGRRAQETSTLQPDPGHGDAYGVLHPQDLAPLLPAEQQPLLTSLAALARQLELHLGAGEGVSLRLRVRLWDAAQAGELERLLAPALVLARDQARSRGQTLLADALDQARLSSGEGGLLLAASLPSSLLEAPLGACPQHGAP